MTYYYKQNTYLQHHGILGMRWGVRNGPPYPIGVSRHSASEKRAGWRKSLDKPGKESHNRSGRTGLSDKQKKAIKVGAAVVAGTLAVAGTAYLVKTGKVHKYIRRGKTQVALSGSVSNNLKLLTNSSVSNTEHGIKKLTKSETIEQTLATVNQHPGSMYNYDANCTLCAVATYLRQAGFDVRAGSTGGKAKNLGGVVEECFMRVRIIDGSAGTFGKSSDDAARMLVRKFGDNASGVCSIKWKNEDLGHSFNWVIKNGSVSFYDGQKCYNDSIVRKYWKNIDTDGPLILARLDNAEINYDGVKKLLET